VWVDGARVADKTPAAIELRPGRHLVSAKGGQEFLPAEISVDLAPDDTQQVMFASTAMAEAVRPRAQQQAGRRSGPSARGAAPGPNWDQVIRNLGFDPRTVKPESLGPEQRRQYQKFVARMDSLRKANRPRP
jgi:hypothetical protein